VVVGLLGILLGRIALLTRTAAISLFDVYVRVGGSSRAVGGAGEDDGRSVGVGVGVGGGRVDGSGRIVVAGVISRIVLLVVAAAAATAASAAAVPVVVAASSSASAALVGSGAVASTAGLVATGCV